MKKVEDAREAYHVGWIVAALMDKGLQIRPVVRESTYTDTVEWRVMDPNGVFKTVHLTIVTDPPQ